MLHTSGILSPTSESAKVTFVLYFKLSLAFLARYLKNFLLRVQDGCLFFAQQQSSESVWNNRSMKVFLLQHNTPVPTGQFNGTAVRVPNNDLLCTRRGCRCLKQDLERLDKKLILNVLVEEKKEGRDTLLRSILVKDDQCKHERLCDISSSEVSSKFPVRL